MIFSRLRNGAGRSLERFQERLLRYRMVSNRWNGACQISYLIRLNITLNAKHFHSCNYYLLVRSSKYHKNWWALLNLVQNVECKHLFRFVIKQAVLFFILRMVTILSKYPNMFRKFVGTSCVRGTDTSRASIHVTDHCDVYTETRVSVY